MNVSTPRLEITYRPGPDEMAPPQHLRKPYKFALPFETFSTFQRGIKSLLSEDEKGKVQCVILSCKSLAFGMRVTIWLLSPPPGFTARPGMTKDEWDAVCARITEFVTRALPGAMPYKEEWMPDAKFQYSFETAIRECGTGNTSSISKKPKMWPSHPTRKHSNRGSANEHRKHK